MTTEVRVLRKKRRGQVAREPELLARVAELEAVSLTESALDALVRMPELEAAHRELREAAARVLELRGHTLDGTCDACSAETALRAALDKVTP